MTAEAVLELLQQEGGTPGDTCNNIPSELQFQECPCAARTPDYHYREFIARGPRGGIKYICLHLRPDGEGQKIISYGPKGFHHPDQRGGEPCV